MRWRCCSCVPDHRCDAVNEEEQRALDVWMLGKIESKLRKEGECLIWTGPFKEETGNPYERICWRGRRWEIQVRKWLYEHLSMPHNPGDWIGASCKSGKSCVRPEHAIAISRSDYQRVRYEIRRDER
jgi:hypothetical protein